MPTTPVAGDDRVLPATRALSIFIIPFLVVGFAVLFFWPKDTDTLFAWKINPPLTAMLLASVYIGGAWFFVQAARAKSWQTIKGGFVPVGVFATTMGLNTILHWDKFIHENVAFWLWAGLYFTTPFLVFAVFFANRRMTGAGGGLQLSDGATWTIATLGFLAPAMGLFLYVAPKRGIDVWPWMLTPLTARSTSAIFLLGVAGIGVIFDRRWQAVRIPLQVAMVMLTLILVSVLRDFDSVDTDRPLAFVLIAGFVAVLLGAAVLYRKMTLKAAGR
ncbi:MAG: hypothetical protein QOE93_580 [Actinomycetota bacterium]|jgi:hypothetical protein|nr:hypothetical protein [Actinomycetota bacterium]